LFRILVEASSRERITRARDFIIATITKRHQGEEDVTVVTQDAVLATFDRIFQALTLTVAGIAGISLGVAGILIMNIMLVSVAQRTTEIGLLKAIGASARHIVTLFLVEAALLSLFGALFGLAFGMLGAWAMGRIYPALPSGAPLWAIVTALGVALSTGVLFGILPARRAARLDPVTALSRR
jgi:putative ABC transport system permease protein